MNSSLRLSPPDKATTSRSVIVSPSPRLFVLVLVAVLLGMGFFMWPVLAWPWLGVSLFLLAGLTTDWAMLSRCSVDILDSRWDHQPTVQDEFMLTLEATIQRAASCEFEVLPIQSDQFQVLTHTLSLPQDTTEAAQIQFTMVPKCRGEWRWPGAYLQFTSSLGLLQKWVLLSPQAVSVYPKLTQDRINQLNPLFFASPQGLKINRLRRADQEFESLRPYILGDNFRHIDWKASARSQSLVTRLFQLEHHHQVLVCLDTSRLMGTLSDGMSKLDWAIEASLHLAYLAQRFQDRLGLMVFSNQVDRWVPPANHTVEACLKAVYDLECHPVETDFQQVCLAIMAAQKKRSLVIFLSDFLDAGSIEPVLGAFAQLNQRHCTLFVGVEDPSYHRYLHQADLGNVTVVAEKLVALDAMSRRKTTLGQLRKMGLKTLTVTPQNLVEETMKAYMEIKFRGGI